MSGRCLSRRRTRVPGRLGCLRPLRGSCRLPGPRSRGAPRSRYLPDSRISREDKLACAHRSLSEILRVGREDLPASHRDIGVCVFPEGEEPLLREAHAFQQVDVARVGVKGLEEFFGFYIFHATRPLRVGFFQPLEGMVTVFHQRIVKGDLVG